MIVVEWFCNCDSMIPYHMVEWVHCSKHNGLFHWLTYLMIAAVTCNIIHIINGISWRNEHNLCGAMIMLICLMLAEYSSMSNGIKRLWIKHGGHGRAPKKLTLILQIWIQQFLGANFNHQEVWSSSTKHGDIVQKHGTVDGGHFNFFSVPSQKWCSAIPVAFLMFGLKSRIRVVELSFCNACCCWCCI